MPSPEIPNPKSQIRTKSPLSSFRIWDSLPWDFLRRVERRRWGVGDRSRPEMAAPGRPLCWRAAGDVHCRRRHPPQRWLFRRPALGRDRGQAQGARGRGEDQEHRTARSRSLGRGGFAGRPPGGCRWDPHAFSVRCGRRAAQGVGSAERSGRRGALAFLLPRRQAARLRQRRQDRVRVRLERRQAPGTRRVPAGKSRLCHDLAAIPGRRQVAPVRLPGRYGQHWDRRHLPQGADDAGGPSPIATFAA